MNVYIEEAPKVFFASTSQGVFPPAALHVTTRGRPLLTRQICQVEKPSWLCRPQQKGLGQSAAPPYSRLPRTACSCKVGCFSVQELTVTSARALMVMGPYSWGGFQTQLRFHLQTPPLTANLSHWPTVSVPCTPWLFQSYIMTHLGRFKMPVYPKSWIAWAWKAASNCTGLHHLEHMCMPVSRM